MTKRKLTSLTETEIVIIALLHSMLLLNSCQPEIITLCVHEMDNPATDCPALTQMFNCTECQPLSFYIRNVSKYFTSNIEMMFATGNHCLSPSADGATVVNVSGVSTFTMKGLGSISYNASEEGAIQSSSVITCSCSQNKSGLLFYKSNTIHIENLTLEDCGKNLYF